jgi:hypothetical protein
MATTRAIDFGALIGAQLTAIIEAEAEAAETSAEFIENVGFESGENGSLRLKVVTFEMKRRDADGDVRTHMIQVPVITLVPIPLLTIESATMEFDLRVEDVVRTDTSRDSPRSGAVSIRNFVNARLVGSAPPKARLITRLASTTKTESRTTSDLRMKVSIGQSGFPVGIERMLTVAELSVDDATLEKVDE